jgi:copper(I)-binding protein
MNQDNISSKRRVVEVLMCRPPVWLAMALSVALWLAFAGAVHAAGQTPLVEHARIRWLPGNLALAGYFDLTNTGKRPLTLTGASSDAFGGVMMHRSVRRGGQTQMLPAENLEVQAGKTLHFAPEGYHLMLMNRKRSLAVGDQVPIRLEFSGGHSMEVTFAVKGADMQ